VEAFSDIGICSYTHLPLSERTLILHSPFVGRCYK